MTARTPAFPYAVAARRSNGARRLLGVFALVSLIAVFGIVSSGWRMTMAGEAGSGRARKKVKVVSSTTTKPAAPAVEVPASIVIDRPGGARRLAATLPGRILDQAFPKAGDGHRRIVLLVDPPSSTKAPESGPANTGTSVSFSIDSSGSNVAIQSPTGGISAFADVETPRWLAWIDPAGEGRVEIVRRDVPGDVRSIDTIDRDGDGREEIVLWRPGGLWIVLSGSEGRPDGTIEPLVTDPELDPQPLAARALCTPRCVEERRIWTGLIGTLRAYGPAADGSPGAHDASARAHASDWTRVLDIPLPVNANKQDAFFTLWSPAVRVVPDGAGTTRVFAIGPEPFGRDRLRTLLVDPLKTDEPPKECWSRLPGPERPVESAYLRIGGKPALAVTTRSAVKLGLFAEKWLRLFLLEEDRTRRGAAPVLALETKINIWQQTVPQVHDVDGDGRDDLVLPYWKGLKNGHVQIDTYLQNEDGTFSRSARGTSFEIAKANRSFLDFGRDLDGDGRADLVLIAGGTLEVHAGSSRSKKGDDLVDSAARYTLPFEAEGAIHVNMPKNDEGDGDETSEDAPPPARKGPGVPLFVDLDGDGRDEIVVVGGGMGDGRLVAFTLPKATGAQ